MKARTLIIGGAGTAVALLAAALIYANSIRPQLELGVGYGARVACGCRYIGNRTLESCRKDFEPGMESIQLAENAATKTVTASVPLLARRSVRFDPVLGCQPEALR